MGETFPGLEMPPEILGTITVGDRFCCDAPADEGRVAALLKGSRRPVVTPAGISPLRGRLYLIRGPVSGCCTAGDGGIISSEESGADAVFFLPRLDFFVLGILIFIVKKQQRNI